LYYNYHRDYDPSLGRYIQSDPIGLSGGLNTYGYVGANPLMRADPLAFGINMGECFGSDSAQYWADKALNSGNPFYHILGALAALWTPDTSEKTIGVLFLGYGLREAGRQWLMADGISAGHTVINIPRFLRIERHPFGRVKKGTRQNAWHSHLFGGKAHRPLGEGVGVGAGVLAVGVAASGGVSCGCD